jgi:hypothetical protein
MVHVEPVSTIPEKPDLTIMIQDLREQAEIAQGMADQLSTQIDGIQSSLVALQEMDK